MSTTTNRNYPYPNPTGDGADVSYWMQRLAESVDTDVESLFNVQTFSPLAPLAGWSAGGTIDSLRIGNRRQVNYFIEVKRTGAILSYVASATMTDLGTILPPEARGSGSGIYAPVMWSGSGANGIMQGYLSPGDGKLSFRHTANVNINPLQNLYFTGTYYTAV